MEDNIDAKFEDEHIDVPGQMSPLAFLLGEADDEPEDEQRGYDCNEHDHANPYIAAGVAIAVGTIAAAVYAAMQYWQ